MFECSVFSFNSELYPQKRTIIFFFNSVFYLTVWQKKQEPPMNTDIYDLILTIIQPSRTVSSI